MNFRTILRINILIGFRMLFFQTSHLIIQFHQNEAKENQLLYDSFFFLISLDL